MFNKNYDNRFINELVFQKLEGRITRLAVEDVEKEIELAKETQENVEDHAKKSWSDRK